MILKLFTISKGSLTILSYPSLPVHYFAVEIKFNVFMEFAKQMLRLSNMFYSVCFKQSVIWTAVALLEFEKCIISIKRENKKHV